MTEDELQLSPNELEGLLIHPSNCVLIGSEEINLKKWDTYIDKIRPFFVSTLERRIYALLEKFVYGEDADRYHEQFPCLKKCIDTATTSSGPANEHCTKYMGTEIVQGAVKGTIKYLIKEGLFTAFINSVVLNNRINRICRELDALGVEKTCLGYLNVWNFVCEKDYWTVNPFEPPRDDPLSDLVVEVGTEDQECLPCKNLKIRACHDPNNENDFETETSSTFKIRRANSNQEITKSSGSCSHKKSGTEYLRLSISKIQFAACGCVDVIRPKKIRRLRLPCKSEDLIRKIFKVDKSLPHSCLTPIRKKFDEAVHNISSCLNDVLSRTDSRSIKNLNLVCEIRPGYVSFKLKSIQCPSTKSKPCLFCARVATCRNVLKNQMSFRNSLTKEEKKIVQRKEISDQNLGKANRLETSGVCRESHLSDVQETEEEIYEIDGIEFRNIADSEFFRREINSMTAVQIRNSNDLQVPQSTCSCGQVSICSRSSFFKIEMKLQDVSKCFKKPVLKEGEPVLKMKERDKTDSQKTELGNLKEIGEPDLKKTVVTCNNLKESEQSNTIIPVTKEADTSACNCWDPLKSKTNNYKTVPESQEHSESGKSHKNFEKSQIPMPISSRRKLSQIPTTRELKANLASNQLHLNLEIDKNPIPKACGTNCSKIPVLVKEKSPVISSCRESSSSFLCKNQLDLNLKVDKKIIPNICRISSSKIPVLVKEKSQVVSGCRETSSSLPCKNRLRSNENLDSLTSMKRVSRTQRCSKFLGSNQLKKSDHLVEAAAFSKWSNLTFIKSLNPSVATLPKTPAKVPKPTKRNLFRRENPPSTSSSPIQQFNIEFRKLRTSVCSKTSVEDEPKTSLKHFYQRSLEKVPQTTYIIVTDSEERIDQCDLKCPCHASLDRMIQNLETSKDTNHLKSKFRELVRPIGIEKGNTSNFRTVSVQTVEQEMKSKGINIDIRETKETLSKGVHVDRKNSSTKGVNTDLIPKDSFISLQTNVTKMISVFDITIFEGDFVKKLKKPLNTTNNLCCSKREKNPTFNLRSDDPMNSDRFSAKICKAIPKINVRSYDRRHKMRIGGSWLTSNKPKAQNIINAICDPFSNKSINWIKYLIRTKLCRMLLDRDPNEGSKTFISNERYYISASSEKTCYSTGQAICSKSSKSGNSNVCCKKKRMSGGSDNPSHECPIRIGSGWEFDGGDDCFLIRKKKRISKGRNVKISKDKELRMSKENDFRTSKEDIMTSNGKNAGRYNKNYSDLEGWWGNKSIRRDEDRSKSKEKNISPGDMITSCHLGRRHEKRLRKKGFNTYIHHESDKENGGKDYKRSLQVRSNFGRERGQLLSQEVPKVTGRNRVSSGRREMDESFCDLDQNVRSKLSEYVNLCKSAKYFVMKGSHDVYGVSSTSIPFSDRSELRRP